ncbi:WD40 repeat-like protein [Moniliophthora roreri MCA 2997]|uniref:WD40 repeat-like protein n=1 Tax=Moniliophthora roreri (strain MCA 2997) TaxID=1381753 RepID=V2Y485_MONRO|nr:WD40 repeat-like protein [Moniliophthora roreri MCA 2997]
MDHENELRHLQLIFHNEEAYQELLNQKGALAQSLLDLLQLLIDSPRISARLRSSICTTMIRLSKASDLHPSCLTIKSLNTIGNHPVAAGGFGDIWKGILGGESGQLVCLKVVKMYLMSDMKRLMKEYLREAIVWRQLRHPNILPCLGLYYLDCSQERICLVSPWMENGNLVQFLRDRPRDSVNHLQLMHDIASGLSHLHGLKVIHGDLKGLNILVTQSHRACIADFGLSHVADSELYKFTSSTTRVGGTARWSAPEVHMGSRATKESDIYSYGCVCYEIISRSLPFHDLPNDAAVVLAVLQRRRPSKPQNAAEMLPDELWSLMNQCWETRPESRPGAEDILRSLINLIPAGFSITPAEDWDHRVFTELQNSIDRQYRLPQEVTDFLSSVLIRPVARGRASGLKNKQARQEQNGREAAERPLWKSGLSDPGFLKPPEQLQEATVKRKASPTPSDDLSGKKRARTELDPIGFAVVDKTRDLSPPPSRHQTIRDLLPHMEKIQLKRGSEDNAKPRDAIRMLGGHEAEVFVCAWNPVKRNLLAVGAKNGVVQIWDLSNPPNSISAATLLPDPITFNRPDGAEVTCLDWNPQGTLLCIASYYDTKVCVCDITGKIVFQTDQHKSPIFTARFSPTGRWIATASLDNTSLLIDIEARRVHRHFEFHKDCCLDIGWINDNVFASCGADHYIYVYGIHKASPLKTFGDHTGEINHIKVNSSGTRLASCSSDMTTRIWNVAGVTSTLDPIPSLGGYSPVVLRGHTHSVNVVEWFSPPDQTTEYLATGGFDGDVRIWNSVTGQCLHRFSEHERPVYAVAVAPNCCWMATGGSDGWLHIYNLKNNWNIWSWNAGTEKPGVLEVEWQVAEDGEVYRIAAALESSSVAVMDVRQIPAIWDTR